MKHCRWYKVSSAALALSLGISLGAPAVLADSLSAERVRALVERRDILPLEEILRRNRADLSGRIIEIEIEKKRSTYVYEIKVLRPDGRYQEFKFDARSGLLMRED